MSLYNSASTSNFREYANNGRFNDSIRQTISIWVNPTSAAPAAQQIWVARGDGTVSGEWTCGTPASATFQVARASVTTGSGLQSVADTIQWTQRKWFHFCQTYDSVTNDLRLYVDGKLRANSTPAGSWTMTTTAAVRLWMRTGLQNPGDQYVEQFGWWKTVFRPDEVSYLANGGDFTKIRRDDALILDPLKDPSQRELVAGLGVNTGTITQREAAPIILRSPLVPLAKPFLFPAATRKRYSIGPLGGDVTVAITGVSATGSVGSVLPSTDVPVTGNAGTSSVGTVAPSTTVPVTGNGATGSVGSVTENHPGTVAATGVSATGAAGTVVPSTSVAVTGNAATGSPGSVTPSTAVAVTGVAATGSAGTVAPSTTVGVTGVTGTGAVGTVTASGAGTTSVSGVSGTGAAGTVTPSTSVAATGVAGTGSPGTVAPATSLAVTGVAGTGAAGAVTPNLTVGITGVSATGAVGTVSAGSGVGPVTVAISGVAATGAVGSVTVSGGNTTRNPVYRLVTGVLARFDASLALVASASSSTGHLHPGTRFLLEKEPLPAMDGMYHLDVESITPIMRNRAIGEAYWEAIVVTRVAYYRGGGDAAGGDRQSVMRDGLGDAMRLADVTENPTNYDSSTTGISEIRYQGAVRAATFKRGEIWETRFMVRWRSDSFAA